MKNAKLKQLMAHHTGVSSSPTEIAILNAEELAYRRWRYTNTARLSKTPNMRKL